MKLVIALDGVAPGVGKTWLADQLERSMCDGLTTVEHFKEEHVLTHPACAQLVQEFMATGRAMPDTCLTAARSYLAWLEHSGSKFAVLDALLPFIPSLMGWGHAESEIDDFVGQLSELARASHVVLVYLDGDPREALLRAMAREPDGWLEWLIATLAKAAGEPVVDLDSLCSYLQRRRCLTIRLLKKNNWPLVIMDDSHQRSSTDLAKAVLTSLGLRGNDT